MTSSELRESFLNFFHSKGHTIVPSASLMPDSPNLLFTNAGMNPFVPFFIGEREPDVDRWAGARPAKSTRAADTQKCIRAGGKHNDLDDVGLDTYHHTFFEMLGNWSFGDYFKEEAISWAWELLVERWKFPVERLYATVYSPAPGDPSEFDAEAHALWAALFKKAGLDPAVHIVNGNRKDNFWMMGDTGPCGPCSEVHVDLTPLGDTKGSLVNKGDARCIEIWNLVFIQFNANPDGTFVPLPARHVDTGMGFERVASVIQGTKGLTDFKNAKISNYDTDIFRPLFNAIEELSGRKYGSTLPPAGSTGETQGERDDVAFRVIADHIRTLSFAVADGIQPGNADRGYVLRRILRRAVRYGRTLGLMEPFFHKLVAPLDATMGEVFPTLRERRARVESVLKGEEEAFHRTLDKGIALFETEAERLLGTDAAPKKGAKKKAQAQPCLSGDVAFKLYDEQGFPLDLTEVMARERGIAVDKEGFEKRMEEQRDRARRAQKRQVVGISEISAPSTEFVGYESLSVETEVLDVVSTERGAALVTASSPFYAEMGGQTGDAGRAMVGGSVFSISNTQKAGGVWLHLLDEAEGPEAGRSVVLEVDRDRRRAIERHHTVTHLLHWALHEVVGRDVTQKGSSVTADKLTFDFNSLALTRDQLATVERLVNERVLENAPVSWSEVPHASVSGQPDIMQFFGDKYGDRVRVVQVGGTAGALDGYSMELCGGTHTRATGEIGLFRVVSEGAVSTGVRRIEAVAGLPAWVSADADSRRLAALAEHLGTPLVDLEKRAEQLLARQKELEKQLRALAEKQAGATAVELLANREAIGGTAVVLARLDDHDGDALQNVLEALKARFEGVAVLFAVRDGAVAVGAVVSSCLTSKVQAGKLVQETAQKVGGRGGGRPEMARGAGKDASAIPVAIEQARKLITASIG